MTVHCRRAAAWAALVLLGSGCAAQQPSAAPGPGTGDPALLETGNRLALASPAIARLWPGFWSPRHGFILAQPHQAVLLVSERAPDSVYSPLPPRGVPRALRGRAYLARGEVPGLNSSRGFAFDLRVPVAGSRLTAVPLKENPAATIEFLVHEAFHAFQLDHFAPPAREDVAFDARSASDPWFAALAEVERRQLARALAVPRDSLEHVLRGYLAVRARRYSAAAASVREEELHLERIEGSAYLAGVTAAAISDGSGPDRVAAVVRDHLSTPLDVPDARWLLRARVYGTGAAIGILLDRLGVEWKARLQEGATFHALLAGAVPLRPGEAEDLATRVLEEAVPRRR
ncbi:MAG TPA: hypothetical protein VGC13_12070 [Longimicrobium sp.]|jgi:hypothetical protein|uniref:hypothetical protein n=1 Tax=Longimicrobium sp. TaxID=2029185 RepID=UPI002ED88759